MNAADGMRPLFAAKSVCSTPLGVTDFCGVLYEPWTRTVVECSTLLGVTDFCGSCLPPRLRNRPVYLVCTSAGEVGVNLSGDHLICDLTTFESMAQRFGRVNRFGDGTDTESHFVYSNKFDEKDPYEQRRKKTVEMLQQLSGDASPAALSQLDLAARQPAFAPKPDIPLPRRKPL